MKGGQPMIHALVPELAVSDWRRSRGFYCDLLGFEVAYDRPDEGFSYLTLGPVSLMIDQINLGRTFDGGHAPDAYPFGRGLNLQIMVPDVAPMLARLSAAGWPLFLPLEDRWYRRDQTELGNRQFVVADPDGYLLRFAMDLGTRLAAQPKPGRVGPV
jgi:catechol 2,3-dioxygenase-like lactoylglutathione lyase family enzyme